MLSSHYNESNVTSARGEYDDEDTNYDYFHRNQTYSKEKRQKLKKHGQILQRNLQISEEASFAAPNRVSSPIQQLGQQSLIASTMVGNNKFKDDKVHQELDFHYLTY